MTPNPPRVPPRVSDERLKSLENLQRDAHGIQYFDVEAHHSLVIDGWERETATLLIAAANVGLDAITDLRDARARITALEEALRETRDAIRPCCNHWDDGCGVCRMNHQQALGAFRIAGKAIRSEGEKP